jgi:hypothetical protein
MFTWYRGLGRTARRPTQTVASGATLALGFSLGLFAAGILSGMGALFTEVFATEPMPPDACGRARFGLSREARA